MKVRSVALLMDGPSRVCGAYSESKSDGWPVLGGRGSCGSSVVGRRLHNGAGAADHVVQVGPGGDHRVNAVLLLDAEVDDDRVLAGARLGDGVRDLLSLGDAKTEQAVRLRELDEVRAAQGRGRV